MTAFILTVVLFMANAEPVAIIGVFDNRPDCGSKESEIITQAMGAANVTGFVLLDDCKPVKEVNKV